MMAELLFEYGVNVDHLLNPIEGITILMQFCGMNMELNQNQARTNLEVIKFMLEHGASKTLKNKYGKTVWELTNNSPQKDQIRKLLANVEQKYFYKKDKVIKRINIFDNSQENECGHHIIGKIKSQCGCLLL